jgi:predicted GNAT superfamily acetyltransferase
MVVDVTAVDPMIQDELQRAALSAASRAAVEVRLARSNDEIRQVSELLATVWGTTLAASPGPRNVLTAIADTGGYVAGAWAGGVLFGGSFGVTYLDGTEPCLRSQVTGVLHPGRGVGEALKRHQQQWASERGMHRITWTFDPLVRRNARFNLDRLGAQIVRFVPDFYGSLDDGLNGNDETDRCVVSWGVSSPVRAPAEHESGELLRGGHVAAVRPGANGLPLISDLAASPALVATPVDIVGLRQNDPECALAWRRAIRSAFSQAFERGLIADLITSDGFYRFRHLEDTP